MSDKSNNQGRAFEFATIQVLYEAISRERRAEISSNSAFLAGQKAWGTLSAEQRGLCFLAAKAATDTLFALEPNIWEKGDDVLSLSLQTDESGKKGDARDILISRNDVQWQVGLSLKHNHFAVKHSRLGKSLDFAKSWFNGKCSEQYFEETAPVFRFLEQEQGKGTLFSDLKDKEERIYKPLLEAFSREIMRQMQADSHRARLMAEYFLSRFDFYKIISVELRRITIVEAYNLYGTLCQSGKVTGQEAHVKAARLPLPTALLCVTPKPGSKTTLLMCFDQGWQFSLRIHNAESAVCQSLKWDISIVGSPNVDNQKFICQWSSNETL